MGEKYDRYVEAKDNLGQARLDLASAHGGSSKDHMQQSQANLKISQEAEASAWNEMMKDPEG